jgi:DDE family transposase
MGLFSSRHALHPLSLIADLGDRFIRRRVWSPSAVAIALLLLKQGGRKRTYRKMISDMARDFSSLVGWQHKPSAASFAYARKKLTPEQCHELLRAVVAKAEAATGGRFAHASGRRLIAIDSTRMVVPRTPSTVQRFPRPGYRDGRRAHFPQSLAVFAVDVTKRLPLDWVMLSKGHGEREGGLRLAQGLRAGDVVVMDRGFPARALLREMLDRKLDIVVRMTTSDANAWPEVLSFLQSNVDEQDVDVRVDEDRCVRMRLIRRKFRPGRPRKHQKAETMVVLSTLMFPRDDILEIYTARWGVETLLRELKVDLEVEDFHSRSRSGLEQEVAMSLLWIALTSALQHIAEQPITDGRRVVRTHAAHAAERMIEGMCAGKDAWEHYEEDLEWLRETAVRPRPGRSSPRYSKSPFGRFNNGMAK